MKVLVYGAAGSQQFPLIGALIKKGIKVFATTHQKSHLKKLSDAGAIPILADMSDRERLLNISKDIDAVALLIPFFLSRPTDGLTFAKNAIDAAVANNIKLLVWNTSGFILPHKIGNPSIDYRIDVHNYLKKNQLPFITIQPSVYAENLLGPWTAPFVAREGKVAYPTPEEMPVGWIATSDVADFVAEALHRPDLAGNDFQISGLENLTGTELAQKFSIGLGKKVSYYHLPPADFGQILDGIFGAGAGKDATEMYTQIVKTKQFPVMYAETIFETLKKLPVRLTPMEVWVEKFRDAFMAK